MFSAVKNFILTFILALVIFGLIASMVVGLVVGSLQGAIGSDDTGESTSSVITDVNGDIIDIKPENDGNSFNILLIGTDFRPSEFIDYDPEVLKSLYGIEPKKAPVSKTPSGLSSVPRKSGIISDGSGGGNNGTPTDDGKLVFDGGFYSFKYRTVEADTIILMRVDKERGHISYTAFPTDACININGKYVKLSDIYGKYGISFLSDKLRALTGIVIDKYAEISMEKFPKLIDSLGGVEFYVPCNMNYDDYAGNVHIHLSAGRRKLTGDQALQVLMFKNYDDSATTRETTTISFIKAFMSAAVSNSNYTSAASIFADVSSMINTNFTAADFMNNLDLIFKYAGTQFEISVQTKRISYNGSTILIIDEERTLNSFSQYRRIYN